MMYQTSVVDKRLSMLLTAVVLLASTTSVHSLSMITQYTMFDTRSSFLYSVLHFSLFLNEKHFLHTIFPAV